MTNHTDTAARDLSADDLAEVVGGALAGGISKLGSKRLLLEGDGTYSGAGAPGQTVQVTSTLTNGDN